MQDIYKRKLQAHEEERGDVESRPWRSARTKLVVFETVSWQARWQWLFVKTSNHSQSCLHEVCPFCTCQSILDVFHFISEKRSGTERGFHFMQSRVELWALDRLHRTQKRSYPSKTTFPTVEKRTENKEKETITIKKKISSYIATCVR